MLVTAASLDALRTGFRNDFNTGFGAYSPMWAKVATRVPSATASNTYGWIREFPQMREWLGDRTVMSASEGSYKIDNRDFESTIGVKRKTIEDDTFGIYSPMMQGLGQSASEYPDVLTFSFLQSGFDDVCWDGQNFFDDEHPIGDTGETYSNVQAGAGAPWFLLDVSRPLKPFIFQERKKPEFVAMNRLDDEHVFSRAEYRYGADARWNGGYGFPQLAFASEATLDADNYAAQRQAMTSQVGETGKKLNIKPNLMVFGPSNRTAAMQLIIAERLANGGSNIFWKDIDLLEVPWLD